MNGEVWSDANAAIGVINRNGLGKTRHLETGLLWIQQVVAQQRLRFSKVLGKDNPADLYTKHLDTKTISHHLRKLNYTEAAGRAVEAPKFYMISRELGELYYGEEDENETPCEWVKISVNAMSVNKAQPAPWRRQTMIGYINERSHDKTTATSDETSSDLQVLWGYKWQVKGPNGRATAQLDHPRGSARIVQLSLARRAVGAARVLSLGVAMHPRGRHLREGMVLLIHGGVHRQNGDKHITTKNTEHGDRTNERIQDDNVNPRKRAGTTRTSEDLQGKGNNTWNSAGRGLIAVIVGPSRPRIAEQWNHRRPQYKLGKDNELELENQRGKSKGERGPYRPRIEKTPMLDERSREPWWSNSIRTYSEARAGEREINRE